MILSRVYETINDESPFYVVRGVNYYDQHIDWFPHRTNKALAHYEGMPEAFHIDDWRPLSQCDNSGVTTE